MTDMYQAQIKVDNVVMATFRGSDKINLAIEVATQLVNKVNDGQKIEVVIRKA